MQEENKLSLKRIVGFSFLTLLFDMIITLISGFVLGVIIGIYMSARGYGKEGVSSFLDSNLGFAISAIIGILSAWPAIVIAFRMMAKKVVLRHEDVKRYSYTIAGVYVASWTVFGLLVNQTDLSFIADALLDSVFVFVVANLVISKKLKAGSI